MLTFSSLFSLAVALTGASPPAGDLRQVVLVDEADVPGARSTAITASHRNHASVLSAEPSPPRSAARRFDLGAATLQMGTLVGLGVGWYEWQIELNKLDFDFARTVAGQRQRLTTAAGYRFDDNERYLNIGHAGMGALYHQTARVHGAGMGTAYLFNLGTSTFWELAVEHREVVSVNDQLVTGIGGAPLGEALYRISEVFARRKPTVFNRVMTAMASPMRLGAWLGGESPTASSAYSSDGADDSPASHRFALSLGGLAGVNGVTGAPSAGGLEARQTDDAWTSSARGDFEVMALPGYSDAAPALDGLADREGSSSMRLRGGELTRLTVEYAGGAGRFRDFDLVARTTLFGRFDRSVTRRASGLYQSSRVLGAATAFELAYDRAGGVTDFLSLVHVLGPTAELRWAHDGLTVRAEVSGYGDFALVRPLAIGAGAGTAPSLEGTKSTLASHEYYYGWGGTAAGRLEVAYGRLRGGTAAEWNHIDSIEGLDRHQEAYVSPVGAAHEAIADDSNLTDDRLKLRLFLDVPVPFVKRASLGAAADLIHRQGDWQARSLAATQQDRRVALSLTYTL